MIESTANKCNSRPKDFHPVLILDFSDPGPDENVTNQFVSALWIQNNENNSPLEVFPRHLRRHIEPVASLVVGKLDILLGMKLMVSCDEEVCMEVAVHLLDGHRTRLFLLFECHPLRREKESDK